MTTLRTHQTGSTLIEGLAALLIFSFGMMGLAGLNAAMMQQSANAQMRAQASYLAEELLGLATADIANVDCYQMTSSGPASCGSSIAQTTVAEWRNRALATLPGASTSPPTVTYAVDGTLTLTIRWQRPQESAEHRYVSTTNLYPGF